MSAYDLLRRLYIVNDVDRPCKRQVTYRCDDGKLRYLHIDWPAMLFTGDACSLFSFGFHAKIRER